MFFKFHPTAQPDRAAAFGSRGNVKRKGTRVLDKLALEQGNVLRQPGALANERRLDLANRALVRPARALLA